VFFIPMFYYVIETAAARFGGKKDVPPEAEHRLPAPGGVPGHAPHAPHEGD
jgi:hypothetical protein